VEAVQDTVCFAGLIDMSVYCGNKQALEVAEGMASWAKGRLDPLDRNAMQEMLNHTEQGGMNETLANLYGLTGNRQWLELAMRSNADAYNNPLILHRDEPTAFDIRIRVPHWTYSGIKLTINNELQAVTTQPSSFLSIHRTWKDGDRIEMAMPMSLWLCPMPDDANPVAVMYGPMVLAGQLGQVDVPREMVYTTENWFNFPKKYLADTAGNSYY
jgi:DUF1680 family protein